MATEQSHPIVGYAITAGFLIGVVYLVHLFRVANAPNPHPSLGANDLIMCTFLTSIDSKKSLWLFDNSEANLTDNTNPKETVFQKGHWQLLNAKTYLYRIDTPGAAGIYTMVLPPDADSCMLAAGSLGEANLNRSWYATTPDTDDQRDYGP